MTLAQQRECMLPGGLWLDGVIESRVLFRQITGSLELEIMESRTGVNNLPVQVSRILSLALQSIGVKTATNEVVAALCVADRQYLMLNLASLLYGDQVWLTIICPFCSVPFDLDFKRSALLLKTKGAGYPFTRCKIANREICFKIPGGKEQESILGLDEEAAVLELLCLSIASPLDYPARKELVHSLSAHQVALIEAQLEAASPQVATALKAVCPACCREQVVEINPYQFPQGSPQAVYREVHTLAYHYHWSEQDILALSREKRRLYLRFIDQELGFTT